jgi:hypothetical protein
MNLRLTNGDKIKYQNANIKMTDKKSKFKSRTDRY